jgi:hypothetical protein
MATIAITTDQLAALKGKLDTLTADTASANDATAASNDAHTALQKAQADAASKDISEATADGQVTADLTDLQAFVNGLVTAATPPAVGVPASA